MGITVLVGELLGSSHRGPCAAVAPSGARPRRGSGVAGRPVPTSDPRRGGRAVAALALRRSRRPLLRRRFFRELVPVVAVTVLGARLDQLHTGAAAFGARLDG